MVFYHLGDVVNYMIGGHLWIIGCRTAHQQRPADDAHQQGDSSLVDSCQAFEGYAQITNDEGYDDAKG